MRDWWWCVLWALLSAAWCLSAAGELSATFDEPLYIARGLDRWRSGSVGGLLRLGTMPLPIEVQTLPLSLAERWRGVPFDVARDLDRLLPWARAMNLAFWFVLLAYAYWAGCALAGAWGGRLALALLACEPSLLAHASLATTDIAVTACVVALCYHFHSGRGAGWIRRCGVPALWYAAAVLAKASGLVLGPLCLLVIELERRRSSPRAALRDLAWILGGGLLLAFLYCGSDWRPEPSFVAWARALSPEASLRPAMVWLADHLRIFPNAGDGLVRQIRHNLRGHGSYLLGVEHARAFWWYFPVLFTIKLSESVLLLPLLVALRQAHGLINWAMLSAVTLIGYSLTFRVQLGIRMVLPLVALWIIGTAVALARAVEREGRGLTRAAAVIAVMWSATSAITVWPHALSYVNRLWGGTTHGYRLVSDSNYDWGQGVKDLIRWQQQEGGPDLAVWYFGTDPAAQRPPLRLLPLHTMAITNGDDVIAAVDGGRLAVSTTLLYGTTLNDAHRAAAAFLRSRQPVARTMTFFIYDLHSPTP